MAIDELSFAQEGLLSRLAAAIDLHEDKPVGTFHIDLDQNKYKFLEQLTELQSYELAQEDKVFLRDFYGMVQNSSWRDSARLYELRSVLQDHAFQ